MKSATLQTIFTLEEGGGAPNEDISPLLFASSGRESPTFCCSVAWRFAVIEQSNYSKAKLRPLRAAGALAGHISIISRHFSVISIHLEKSAFFSPANDILMTYLYQHEIETYSLMYRLRISLIITVMPDNLSGSIVLAVWFESFLDTWFLLIVLLNWRINVIKIHWYLDWSHD